MGALRAPYRTHLNYIQMYVFGDSCRLNARDPNGGLT